MKDVNPLAKKHKSVYVSDIKNVSIELVFTFFYKNRSLDDLCKKANFVFIVGPIHCEVELGFFIFRVIQLFPVWT